MRPRSKPATPLARCSTRRRRCSRSTCSSADLALQEALEREGGGWGADAAREAGAVAGSVEAAEHGRRAERNEPRLITHDRYGNRVDEVELDPSWHWLLGGAVDARHPQPALARAAARRPRRARGACSRCGATPTTASCARSR